MKITKKTLSTMFAFAILFCGCNGNNVDSKNLNSMQQIIETRTSVRSYTNQPVEKQKVDQLLKAAMSAPSAVNKQPWAFMVINKRKTLDILADSLPHHSMLRSAPLAIVVMGDFNKTLDGKSAEFWIQDCSAAAENILLSAHSLGLGAVWTAVYPADDRIATVKSVLNLDANLMPLCIIPVGYPAENPTPKDKFKPENINWNFYE